MTHEIRLGKPVYGVTSGGVIVLTLISCIVLPENKAHEWNLVQRSSERLNGRLHESVPGIQFRVLDHSLSETWFTFEEAYDNALEVLEQLKNDESIRVRDQRRYVTQYTHLTANKEAERDVVDGVTDFSESKNRISGILNRGEKDRLFTQKDFPLHYIEPSTSIWIADTKSWKLIQGFVTQVEFASHWKRRFTYDCGSHINLRADRVFRTKKGALNCLEREFAKSLPGMLDRRRVPIVQQISNAKKRAQTLEAFLKKAQTR